MNRVSFSLLIISLVIISFGYGQSSILLKSNLNNRANDLKHSISKSGDTLVLFSKKTIFTVDIYNQEYELNIPVSSNNSSIPLDDIPQGKYIVEVQLPDRLIVLSFSKNDYQKLTKAKNTKTSSLPNTSKSKSISVTNKSVSINNVETQSNNNIQSSSKKTKDPPEKTTKNSKVKRIYFIHFKNNNCELFRIGDQKLVDSLICRNKTELESSLIIWTITNVKEFMYNYRNYRDYLQSEDPLDFQSTPYYKYTNNGNFKP